jgi:integrase/recombinase XerD
MARLPKNRKPEKPQAVATADPMRALMEEHLLWMQMQNFSEDTVTTRRNCIGYFIDWCHDRALENPVEITRPILERYQRALYHYRKQNGDPLTFRTQNSRLRAIKGWFRWMARQNYILHNPASELILPRLENRLPKYILTAEEAEVVMQQPDITTPVGLRDRAILETFYATALRRMEVANLKLYDIDAERGAVMIRLGKGKKDRFIPISDRAIAWINKYVREARPELLGNVEDGTVFLTNLGEPFQRVQLTALVRHYLAKSKIGKMGGCHLFRHTVATLMLENGADIRVIQEMLGHAKLTTTEVYTRVSINLLKQVYLATHPAAQGEPASVPAAERNAEAEAELFATLAAEDDEEEEETL